MPRPPIATWCTACDQTARRNEVYSFFVCRLASLVREIFIPKNGIALAFLPLRFCGLPIRVPEFLPHSRQR